VFLSTLGWTTSYTSTSWTAKKTPARAHINANQRGKKTMEINITTTRSRT